MPRSKRLSKARSAKWRQLTWRLQVLFNVGFLVGLSTLDVRDLWYKLVWVGPYDAYAFDAGSRGTLLDTPLSLSMTLPERFTRYEAPITSGWPSYLSRCETLTAFCSPGSTFFLNAMGRNCAVGVSNETRTIERLVMTSNVRSDAMAWAACQLIHGHRQPPLCQANIVSNFMARYGFQGQTIAPEWMALEDSPAEAELLRFIELIAMSEPRDRIVCTGGFDYKQPGWYNPTIFGCASASVFRAEYVGVYATSFHELAYNMAWLTAIDIITVVEMSYKIRQNTINHFDMDEQVINGRVALSVTETTANNFVSSGLLYAVMITIDILLLCSQMYTGVELVTNWILPLMRKQDKHDFEQTLRMLAVQSTTEYEGEDGETEVRPYAPTDFDDEEEQKLFSQQEYTSFLTTSLYRHPAVIVLTVVSQFLSWGLIIPNSVVWTWSLSSYPKAMAYFSSLRLWTLILIAVNLIWDVFVFFAEKRAYFIARDTYTTSFEIIAIGAIISFWKREAFMAISETKFAVERQRVNDVFSFPTYIAHGNTFNEELDYAPISRFSLICTMYSPLLEILGLSVLAVFLRLLLRLAMTRLGAWVSLLCVFRRRAVKTHPKPSGGTSLGPPQQTWLETIRSVPRADPRTMDYRRAAVEKLLNIPMRARSIVRPAPSMEKKYHGEVLLRPPIHLDFGLFVRERRIATRTGFEYIIRAVTQLPVPVPSSLSTQRPQRHVEDEVASSPARPIPAGDLRRRDAW